MPYTTHRDGTTRCDACGADLGRTVTWRQLAAHVCDRQALRDRRRE